MDKSYLAGLTKTDWLCLSFLSGIGPARLSRLYTYLSQLKQNVSDNSLSPSSSLLNNESDLSYELLKALKWPDMTARQAMDYLSSSHLTEEQKNKLDQTLAWLDGEHRHLIIQEDAFYPQALKEINVAPALLYLEGNQETLTLPKIGIVGARKCTRYGYDMTFQFAKQLADKGICVVSGGAIGIDTAAHQGALENQTTPTLAVMGTGLLHRYPNQNDRLFEQVLKQDGALISEYPLTTTPRPHLFPPRNRIISGLSMGILVSEASIKSGSLISASYAVQQNREVFALPGRLSDLQSEGCHQLLRQGATLARNVNDILIECEPMLSTTKTKATKKRASKTQLRTPVSDRSVSIKPTPTKTESTQEDKTVILNSHAFHDIPPSTSKEAVSLAALLEKASIPMDFDSLVRQTKKDAAIMMQILMELELSGCIKNREGFYSRC